MFQNLPKSSFPDELDNIFYDKYSERFAIGLIITRLALNLDPALPLPVPNNPVESLIRAANLTCRGNLLRLIALKLLNPDKKKRPSFAECMHHISGWPDDMFHHFLTRFADYAKADLVRRNNIKALLSVLADDICEGFDWFTPQKLGAAAYNCIFEAVRVGDCAFWTNPPPNTPDGHIIIKNYIARDRVYGLLMQYRNRAMNIFKFLHIVNNVVGISKDYANFWRDRFRLMVTGVWLIAIQEEAFRNSSLDNFFTCNNHNFYKLFQNQNCQGEDIVYP